MKAGKNSAQVSSILFVNFTGTFGFSIVLPFLIFLVIKFGGNAVLYGVLASAYPFFQLVGAPILGRWSDKYGRKKILLLSVAGTLLGWLIFLTAFFLPVKKMFSLSLFSSGVYSLTLPLLVLFIARGVDRITGGNISVANAYLSDISSENDRTKNFGKMSVAANAGFILGPAAAGLLGSTIYKELVPVLAALIISFISVLFIFFYLPESEPMKYEVEPGTASVTKILGFENKDCFKIKNEGEPSLKKVLKTPGITFLFILYFLIFLGFNFFYTAFPVHLVQELKWSIAEMGVYFSIMSFLLLAVEGPLLSHLSKKFSAEVLVIAGSLILGTNFLFLMSSKAVILYTALILFALGNGLMWPSLLSLLSKTAGNKYQGAVQGYASSTGSLASIIGLVIGGMLYSSIGNLTFLVCAIVIYLVFVLSLKLLNKKGHPSLNSTSKA